MSPQNADTETAPRLSPEVQAILQESFGFDALRRGQDEVVAAVLSGRDCMAIMPTGGGKSLCYQLPALCLEGLTIVVSPLIALMKDQVDALQTRGISAAALNSSLTGEEYSQVMRAFYADELKILYVAPERFGQASFIEALQNKKIALLAIDEAHCLSQWGHDFRPDYLRLGRVRESLGFPQTMALTATATEAVRNDILKTLQLHEPATIISGFARENLNFSIVHCESRKAKFTHLRQLVNRWKTGIIYCSTRKNVMAVFEELRGTCSSMVAYHAGMTDNEREFSQNEFISGRADVVVATNAFGMGIDRADVRFVAHFEIPGSVEAYYQEAGRAGRDGQKSACDLLFNHADIKTQEFFFEGSNPPLELVRNLYSCLCVHCDRTSNELIMTVDEITTLLGKGINPMGVSTAFSLLIHAGAIERFDVPGKLVKGTRVCDPTRGFAMLSIDSYSLEEKAARDHLKIESITRFAYSQACRHMWILNYFGERGAKPCGHCDVCDKQESADAEELSFTQLETVRKALAGVARASRRLEDGSWQGIYGRGKVMDMLRGAKTAKLHAGLTNLSTYGLLKELSDGAMKSLFRALYDAGLLQSSGGEMPLITLSAKGYEVMMSKDASLRMSLLGWADSKAATATRAAKKQIALDSIATGRLDKELLERLKELRRDIADERRMPVFRILSNECLQAMARTKPLSIEAASRLKGVGPWVRQNCLAAFVELIQDYEDTL